jgi:hypothetical protein
MLNARGPWVRIGVATAVIAVTIWVHRRPSENLPFAQYKDIIAVIAATLSFINIAIPLDTVAQWLYGRRHKKSSRSAGQSAPRRDRKRVEICLIRDGNALAVRDVRIVVKGNTLKPDERGYVRIERKYAGCEIQVQVCSNGTWYHRGMFTFDSSDTQPICINIDHL